MQETLNFRDRVSLWRLCLIPFLLAATSRPYSSDLLWRRRQEVRILRADLLSYVVMRHRILKTRSSKLPFLKSDTQWVCLVSDVDFITSKYFELGDFFLKKNLMCFLSYPRICYEFEGKITFFCCCRKHQFGVILAYFKHILAYCLVSPTCIPLAPSFKNCGPFLENIWSTQMASLCRSMCYLRCL